MQSFQGCLVHISNRLIFDCFQVVDWISQGHGSSKKAAKKLAAEKMLSMISEAPKVDKIL